jgi:hypothetical protein
VTPGTGPAVIRAWSDAPYSGYLIAHDASESVRLVFVPADVPASLESVPRISIPSADPRGLALAITSANELALAWRAPAGAHSTLFLSRVHFDPGRNPAFELLSCGELSANRDVLEGPTLIHDSEGTTLAAKAAGKGSLFLTWTEGQPEQKRLMGLRLPDDLEADGRRCEGSPTNALREQPFTLWQDTSIAQPFTFTDSDLRPRYGFVVTTRGEQRLNIGSLKCPTADAF